MAAASRNSDLLMSKQTIRKLVLAYSGGLDTSVILRWLKDYLGCEVIAYCADVGQGDETEGLEQKALETGASKLHLVDLRAQFARDFVFPMLRANAVYEGYYLLGTSIARPVIAKRQIEIARAEGADAVAHGATGKGNDQVRFELTYYALQPNIRVIAPWREPYEDMFLLTVAPEQAPDAAEYVEIDYEAGNPVAVNGDRLSPAELLV